LLFCVSVAPDSGSLTALRMVPMQARKMRLWHASAADGEWLREVLQTISRGFGSQVSRQPDGELILRLPAAGCGGHVS
jgi:poly-gamma-glutamate capsule biosynthesis protein CapA/YwtB (metallophosphatase superfamily)